MNNAIQQKLIEVYGLDTILNKKEFSWGTLRMDHWRKLRKTLNDNEGAVTNKKAVATINQAWAAIRHELLGNA